jgi:hypothetical protein
MNVCGKENMIARISRIVTIVEVRLETLDPKVEALSHYCIALHLGIQDTRLVQNYECLHRCHRICGGTYGMYCCGANVSDKIESRHFLGNKAATKDVNNTIDGTGDPTEELS